MNALAAAIEKVEHEIDQVEADIKTAVAQGKGRKEEQLRRKEEQLRRKEEQLRTEKEQLRTEKEQLREKELISLRASGAARPGLEDDSSWKRDLKAPSLQAQNTALMELQVPEDPFFLMHRPAKARAIPIALIHPLFGRFLDIANGRDGHPTQQDYETAVALCHEFSKFYAEEDERMTAVRAVLERRLEIKLPRLKIDSPAKRGRNPTTDGTAYCDEKEKWAYFWLEVKLEVGMGLADPLAESLGYVWWHTRLQERTHLLLPALIFEQFGPFMRISGVVNTGEHLASEPLTTAVHMLDLRPHQPHLMHTMALACRGLRETEQALYDGYEDGSLQSIDASELPYPLRDPAASKLPAAASKLPAAAAQEQLLVQRGDLPGAVDEQQRRAEQLPAQSQASATVVDMAGTLSKRSIIRIEAYPGVPDKLLYHCTGADGSQTVVKFTTEYCARLHELLSDADLAPEFMDSEHLDGGWFKVEMQFLDPDEWKSFQEVLDEGDRKTIEQARAAIVPCLDRLHNMPGGPWVWGDARPPNIMLRWLQENAQPEVRFIDFDSSGREGEARYPGFRNPRVPSPPGVASHEPMVCSHDPELLQACIEQAIDQSRPGPRRRRSSTALPALSDGAEAGLHTIMQPSAKGRPLRPLLRSIHPPARPVSRLSSQLCASVVLCKPRLSLKVPFCG